MDELKLLVDMVANLPYMAMWVIAAFWAYKVVVIGSVFGVIRLAINKTHSYFTTPEDKIIQLRPMLDGIAFDGNHEELARQIKRIIEFHNRRTQSGLEYMHGSHVEWLKRAIDDKISKDSMEEVFK